MIQNKTRSVSKGTTDCVPFVTERDGTVCFQFQTGLQIHYNLNERNALRLNGTDRNSFRLQKQKTENLTNERFRISWNGTVNSFLI